MQQSGQHAVFLSYDGMTDPLGQSQVIPYLQGLVENGYRLTIISFEKPLVYAAHYSAIQTLLDNSAIQWIPLTYTKSPPVFSTIYDMFRMSRAVQSLHRRNPVHLLHARSYISARVAWSLQYSLDIPWIFDMRGFYADERVDGKLWPLSNPVFRRVYTYFKRKELDFLKDSTAIISLTRAGKEIIETKLLNGIVPEKTSVIPCCADLGRFDYSRFMPEDRLAIRRELRIPPESLVVVYSGSVGTWYLLDEMLDWFVLLLKEYPKAIFLFLSQEKERITHRAKDLGINEENLIVQKVSYPEMPRFLNAADLGIFFIVPTFSKQASSPTKMGELMGMGIPIVCNSGVGDVGDIVRDSHCGIAMDVRDPAQLANSIQEVAKLLLLDKTAIREAAFRFYSLESGIATYAGVYNRILQPTESLSTT